MLAKSLELGSCGLQWQPPTGTIVEHTDTRLEIRDERGRGWQIRMLPNGFAIGEGEEAALSEDLHASAHASGSQILEAKLGQLGAGRCVMVVRQLRNGVIAAHLIVPVAKGAIDLCVASRKDVRAREALDEVVASVELVAPAERTPEVRLPEAGCAFAPPLRFLVAGGKSEPGRGLLARSGLDDWARLLEVWRIGRPKLKGRDLPAELVEHAQKTAATDWPGARSEATHVDDFGVCVQIEQLAQYERGGVVYGAVSRYWLAGDQTLWRITSSIPAAGGVDRDVLREDLTIVQDSFRRT